MFNITLFWYLLVPVFCAAVSYFCIRRLLQNVFCVKEAVLASGALLVLGMLVVAVSFFIGVGFKTSDVQILNGQITGKTREHGHYVESYQCNCREICSGSGNSRTCSTTCDTCYRDHYTVTWDCLSTVGTIRIEHLDSLFRSVYNTPDPAAFTNAYIGEPVAKTATYKNYIKAAPNTLFRPAAKELKEKFAKLVPAYPINVYDHYKINRVVQVGVNIPDVSIWENKLREVLKTLGPTKQVNVVLVVVNTDDPNYVYALRDAWLGGKKNDVVLVVGITDYPKISWVDVISWTDRELFKVVLRDSVRNLGEMQVDPVIDILKDSITTEFTRKRMRDFEYLEAEIDPPGWVLTTMVIVILLINVGFIGFNLYNHNYQKRVLLNRKMSYNRFKI